MTSDEPRYWFPAKRYGWGWGVPRTWQGWAVIVSYCAVVTLAPVALGGAVWTIAVVVAATLALVLVCRRKGEPTRWRWGGEQ